MTSHPLAPVFSIDASLGPLYPKGADGTSNPLDVCGLSFPPVSRKILSLFWFTSSQMISVWDSFEPKAIVIFPSQSSWALAQLDLSLLSTRRTWWLGRWVLLHRWPLSVPAWLLLSKPVMSCCSTYHYLYSVSIFLSFFLSFFFFFWMWTIFKVCIEFVTTLSLFCVLVSWP